MSQLPTAALCALTLARLALDARGARPPAALHALTLLAGVWVGLSQGMGAQPEVLLSLEALRDPLGGALVGALLLAVPVSLFVYRGDDLKLSAALGAALGWEGALLMVAYAVILGALLSLARRKGRGVSPQERIPMALPLALSALALALFEGARR